MPHGPMCPHIQNIFSGWPFPGRGLLVPPKKIRKEILLVVHSWQGPFRFPRKTSKNVLLLVVAWRGLPPAPRTKKQHRNTYKTASFLMMVVAWQGPFCPPKKTPSFVSPGGCRLAGAFLFPQNEAPFSPGGRCLARAFLFP